MSPIENPEEININIKYTSPKHVEEMKNYEKVQKNLHTGTPNEVNDIEEQDDEDEEEDNFLENIINPPYSERSEEAKFEGDMTILKMNDLEGELYGLEEEIRMLEEGEEHNNKIVKKEYNDTFHEKYTLRSKLLLASKLRELRSKRDKVIKEIERKFPGENTIDRELSIINNEISRYYVRIDQMKTELRKITGKKDYENFTEFKDELSKKRYGVLVSIIENLEKKIRNRELKILEVNSRQ